MSLNPIHTTEAIKEAYIRYLTTTFSIKEPELRDQFREVLQEPGKFVKGPILEVTPSFLNGASIQDLVREGVLSSQFLALNSDELPVDRSLYRHQEDAIRKLVEHRRNIVVATGTGSGKTETFMIPIIDHLLKEKTAGKLGSGVRALLLYPMNALANDQMKRLRLLLKNMPDLKFGRYTGETEEKTTVAMEKLGKLGVEPLKNELVSRQQMWESPPHILLTNYAMLEYLLLRPQDSVFFDGPHSGSWKFIVIDEAHVYSGAKGIEIAMLLRRLKDRITGGKNRGIQCIATSATLGNGRDDAPQVVEFASRLFGAEFNWMENDASRQDVVYAAREPLNGEEKGWGQFTPEVYLRLREIIADDTSETIPRLDQLVAQQAPSRVVDLARAQGERYGWQAYLYTILAGDQRVHQLQSLLEEEAQYLAQLADQVFPDTDRAQDCLIALVDLGSQARLERESRSLLPARYHIFVKSLDGAYVALSPAKRLFLEPQRTTEIDRKTYRAFEIATCRNCGALYLTGKCTEIDDRDYLVAADEASAEYYLVETALEDTGDIDEDEDVGIADLGNPDLYNLCLCCGAIDRLGSLGELCDCPGEHHQVVTKVPANKNDTVSTCTACGRTSPLGIIRRFLVGSDAAAAVLATALYQEIEPQADDLTVSSQNAEDDHWGAGPEEVSSKLNEKGSRKLLAFSDSRQDAAFFAPYLNRTYNQIQRRNLILRTIHSYRQQVLSNQWRVNDLIEPLLRVTEDLEWFGRDMSRQMRKDEVTRWLIHELMALDRRNSLEGLGLLGFSLVKPSNWFSPRGLEGPLGLSSDEVWTLVSVLLDTLRRQGAILFPDNVSPRDEFFSPRNREHFFRSHSDSAGRAKGIMGWNSNRLNSRLDYLQRLASNTQAGLSNEDCRILLNEIWNRFIVKQYKDGFFKDYFVEDNLRGEGVVFRLRPEMWELRPTLIDDTLVWYICDKCNSLTLHNLRDTCTTFRCNGRLRPCHPQEINANNHYYLLYQNILPQRMIAQEHTAQLTSGAAADLQNKFLQGKVNILSCSTTFELGVDVGSLETVFMRNVPPTTANYVQRAGRAGRRKTSAALALTFAQRRSHDFDHYREPWRMVSGKIGVPHFKLENHKIIRRHMNAMALASFWYKHQPYFGKGQGRLKDFFLNNPPGPEAFADYLRTQPADLLDALRRVVPPHLHDDLGIDDWVWVETLFQGDEAYLAKAAEEVLGDLTQLEELRHQYFEQRKNLDHLNRLINTIENKNLIGYLASRSVLPKYGFPVDVVELQLPHHGEEARRLQLERDLRIAISEYAPGGQVVAGGRVWTSRYIKRRPNKAWERFKYAICPNCSNFVAQRVEVEGDFVICSVCQSNFGWGKGTFVVPSFGFIADNRPPGNPGENRPDRTFSTRVFFSGEVRKEEVPTVLDCGHISISAIPASFARLTVINKAGNSGFKVCSSCGYTILGDESAPNTHPRPWGGDCRGSLENRLSLGHRFDTDILKLTFHGHRDNNNGFWLSLLYALLEGASAALDIERQDLDGCIYYAGGDALTPQLILYDEVPGGAGHVHRMANPTNLTKVLQMAWKRLAACDCGGKEGHASCYSCLRNYRNQYCHEKLDRRVVMDFLAQFQDLLA